MLNANELLFIYDCVDKGINHYSFPKNETESILIRYLMEYAMGEDYTTAENICRSFIQTELARREAATNES